MADHDLGAMTSNTLYSWTKHPFGTTSKTCDGLDREVAIAAIGAPPCRLTSGFDCDGNLLNSGL